MEFLTIKKKLFNFFVLSQASKSMYNEIVSKNQKEKIVMKQRCKRTLGNPIAVTDTHEWRTLQTRGTRHSRIVNSL
jgi:nickel-dependent lactate racemase